MNHEIPGLRESSLEKAARLASPRDQTKLPAYQRDTLSSINKLRD